MALNQLALYLFSLLLLLDSVMLNPVPQGTTSEQCAVPMCRQIRSLLGHHNVQASFEPNFGPTIVSTTSNVTCPESVAVTSSMTINERSSCPWEYVLDQDPNRFPVTISKVVCRCSKCLMNTGQSTGSAIVADSRCEPVYYNMKVLRRVSCPDGTHRYEMAEERVPVACSCRRPEIILPAAGR